MLLQTAQFQSMVIASRKMEPGSFMWKKWDSGLKAQRILKGKVFGLGLQQLFGCQRYGIWRMHGNLVANGQWSNEEAAQSYT